MGGTGGVNGTSTASAAGQSTRRVRGTTFTRAFRRQCPRQSRKSWRRCWPSSERRRPSCPTAFSSAVHPDRRYLEVETHQAGQQRGQVARRRVQRRDPQGSHSASNSRSWNIAPARFRRDRAHDGLPEDRKGGHANRRNAETAWAHGGRRRRRLAADAGVRGISQASRDTARLRDMAEDSPAARVSWTRSRRF